MKMHGIIIVLDTSISQRNVHNTHSFDRGIKLGTVILLNLTFKLYCTSVGPHVAALKQ